MTKVNTVLGTIPAEELEIVAVHEHIGYGMPGSELDTTVVEDAGAGLRGDRAEAAEVPRIRRRDLRGRHGHLQRPRRGLLQVPVRQDRRAHRRLHRLRRRRHRPAALLPRDRGLPREGVHPRDHRRHRQHRRQGRRHQGRREPRRTHDGPGQAHLPGRGPRRRRHRRADPDPPGDRSRTGRDHLQRRGPLAGPRALRPRRRRPQRPITPHDWIYEQGGRIGFDTFGYDTRAAGSAVLGPQPRRNAWSTSSTS